MRVLIYGAGAIGGYLGAILSRSGVDITILARGATFDVIKSHGLVVDWAIGNEHLVVNPPVRTSDESDGLFDLIFVTLKSMQIASSAENIISKLKPQGYMVMIQNGLPWWYFEGIDSPWRGASLSSLDPNRILKKYINCFCSENYCFAHRTINISYGCTLSSMRTACLYRIIST